MPFKFLKFKKLENIFQEIIAQYKMTENSCVDIFYKQDESIKQLKANQQQPSAFNNLLNRSTVCSRDLHSNNKKNQFNKYLLKKLVTKNKVKNLTNNFIKKLRRNSIYRNPIEDFESDGINSEDTRFLSAVKKSLQVIGQKFGIVLGSVGLAIWSLINILQITLMVFIFSIMVTFPETLDFQIFLYFRIFSVILYVVDMVLNFITQRYESGENLRTIGQIVEYYLKNGFIVDLISILIFPIDLLIETNITILISFLALIKLVNNLKKFEKFEYLYITTSEREQYYGLIKVFLMNFTIGHFLSIFLNLMAKIQEQNWLHKVNIQDSEWYIKYIWGYYWGTNIMLTVGFGDLSASNHYQAIILIFIETFSCITLAYNISYVGALISSMKQNRECKKRKMKTFHKMCKQNQIPGQIETKITNFIEQSYRIKETFEHDYEEEVLNFLPKTMQSEYIKESNKILFDNLGFLSNLSKKSLLKLAECISRKICHPEEVIVKKDSFSNFMILRKGEIGMTCRSYSKIDGKVIQMISVNEDKIKPKILSLDFIKNKTRNYSLKSLNYSIIYYLTREEFSQALQDSEMDYHLFCMLRDRDQVIIDESELYICSICKNQYHNKFNCPRLHYIPIKQCVIHRYLKNVNIKKQKRMKISRINKYHRTRQFFPLINQEQIKDEQKKYLKDHIGEDQFEKVQELMNFYFRLRLQDENSKKFYSRRMSLENPQLCLGSLVQPRISETKRDEINEDSKSVERQNSYKVDQKLVGTLKSKTLLDIKGNNTHNEKTLNLLEEILVARNTDNSFWDMEIDEAHDFKYYFEANNPCNANSKGYSKKKNKMFVIQRFFSI